LSLSDTGLVAGETFTVTLTDTYGLLLAPGNQVHGSGTTSLTFTGLLSQVNGHLAHIKDTDPSTAPDTLQISASDSLGAAISPVSVAITVTPLPSNPDAQAATFAQAMASHGAGGSVSANRAPLSSQNETTARLSLPGAT
jgi:hypothetical protein